MNRRQAILGILAASVGVGVASYGGWNIYRIKKSPALNDLEQFNDMIAYLVDLIIPPTNTPGAKELAVHRYVILMIKDASSKKEQNSFINGLYDLRTYCKDQYDKDFEQCSHFDKINALKHLETEGSYAGIMGKIRTKLLGRSFFTILKELTIEGYFTSEVGATKCLDYQHVPSKYVACMDIDKNKKSWATK